MAELTISPEYKNCTAFGQESTIDMNGCVYKFKSPAGTPFKANVELSCPVGSEIVVTVGDPTLTCTVNIGSQSLTEAVELTNQAGPPKDVLVTAIAKNIAYVSSGGICGKSGTNGTYKGTVTEKGFSNAGLTEPTGIFVE